jgi:hypothetical protein
VRGIPEPPLPPSDPELEKTIRDLIYRMNAAREGSAELRLVMRGLESVIVYEEAQAIMEDYGLFMNHRRFDPRTEPGRILPLSRPPRRTSGSRPSRDRA